MIRPSSSPSSCVVVVVLELVKARSPEARLAHGHAKSTSTYLWAGRWENHLHSPIVSFVVVLVAL